MADDALMNAPLWVQRTVGVVMLALWANVPAISYGLWVIGGDVVRWLRRPNVE